MTRFETPRVAIIGAGDAGCGWAAIIVASGWPVALYDGDADSLARAPEEVARRVDMLIRLGRAEATIAQEGLHSLRIGRSLLHTVNDADWIVEAVSEDLGVKQKLLEQVEQVSRLASIVTSSTNGFSASALCARLRRPERMLVAHPLAPIELLPSVEVVPGPKTDQACVEDVRFWLSLLGRAPVVLKKEIPGNLIGRISAAVWRECIQMVLDGVLDVDDVDRAVALGPALAWAAAGPHLTHRLASRDSNADAVLSNLLAGYAELWEGLAGWSKLSPEDQKKLIRAVDRAYGNQAPELREERNRRLVKLLEAIG